MEHTDRLVLNKSISYVYASAMPTYALQAQYSYGTGSDVMQIESIIIGNAHTVCWITESHFKSSEGQIH